MAVVYLILGSNLGNRYGLLENTKLHIAERVGVITGQSSVYESEPWGFTHENLFLNQVISVETKLSPLQLLDQISEIENKLGRIRNAQGYEARTIDIDILFFDQEIISEARLTIPHPEIQNRQFVLQPMAELAADFIHPVFKATIADLKEICSDNGKIRKL